MAHTTPTRYRQIVFELSARAQTETASMLYRSYLCWALAATRTRKYRGLSVCCSDMSSLAAGCVNEIDTLLVKGSFLRIDC